MHNPPVWQHVLSRRILRQQKIWQQLFVLMETLSQQHLLFMACRVDPGVVSNQPSGRVQAREARQAH
jgi:hypothetical protein